MTQAHKLGVSVGVFLAVYHAIWLILVYTGTAKPLMDWILGLHFLSIEYSMQPFEPGKAALLIVVALFSGYATGWLIATGFKAMKG